MTYYILQDILSLISVDVWGHIWTWPVSNSNLESSRSTLTPDHSCSQAQPPWASWLSGKLLWRTKCVFYWTLPGAFGVSCGCCSRIEKSIGDSFSRDAGCYSASATLMSMVNMVNMGRKHCGSSGIRVSHVGDWANNHSTNIYIYLFIESETYVIKGRYKCREIFVSAQHLHWVVLSVSFIVPTALTHYFLLNNLLLSPS